jgi:hypothetical protein
MHCLDVLALQTSCDPFHDHAKLSSTSPADVAEDRTRKHGCNCRSEAGVWWCSGACVRFQSRPVRSSRTCSRSGVRSSHRSHVHCGHQRWIPPSTSGCGTCRRRGRAGSRYVTCVDWTVWCGRCCKIAFECDGTRQHSCYGGQGVRACTDNCGFVTVFPALTSIAPRAVGRMQRSAACHFARSHTSHVHCHMCTVIRALLITRALSASSHTRLHTHPPVVSATIVSQTCHLC